MTEQQHQITPPPKIFKQWEDDILNERENVDYVLDCAWRNGFQAGADQELEACCEWMKQGWDDVRADKLRAARRPKPPSLKEQALSELDLTTDSDGAELSRTQVKLIRRALEQLDD